jgi:hypothetical protein
MSVNPGGKDMTPAGGGGLFGGVRRSLYFFDILTLGNLSFDVTMLYLLSASRVTRLGVFTPIGQLLTVGSF